MNAIGPTIAGIAIPDSALAREATEFVRETASPLLFDHSRRVFLWASLQAERLSLDYDAELLYVGAMFHDVGLIEGHRSAARALRDRRRQRRPRLPRAARPARGAGHDRLAVDRAAHDAADPDYLQPEVRLVALGVQYDVLGTHFDTLTAEQRERSWPPTPGRGSRPG